MCCTTQPIDAPQPDVCGKKQLLIQKVGADWMILWFGAFCLSDICSIQTTYAGVLVRMIYALRMRKLSVSFSVLYLMRLFSIYSAGFTYGQVLPTHRLRHSSYGGLFQPTMTQAIRLLSHGPYQQYTVDTQSLLHSLPPASSATSDRTDGDDIPDPFSMSALTYSTTGQDSFPAPSAYLSRRHAWIHIFPEGFVHQHPQKHMRYFKWGVSRLILEAEPCPDVVPMWIEGPQDVMHESRKFPRFIPRPGKTVSVTFGEKLDESVVFEDLRRRWLQLKNAEEGRLGRKLSMGELTDALKYGDEAVNLRMECTMRVRREVLKLRKRRGLPDEDPKAGWVETYRQEGPKREGQMEDESWVKET
jgi:monolysocardiolipin acyltransferase